MPIFSVPLVFFVSLFFAPSPAPAWSREATIGGVPTEQ